MSAAEAELDEKVGCRSRTRRKSRLPKQNSTYFCLGSSKWRTRGSSISDSRSPDRPLDGDGLIMASVRPSFKLYHQLCKAELNDFITLILINVKILASVPLRGESKTIHTVPSWLPGQKWWKVGRDPLQVGRPPFLHRLCRYFDKNRKNFPQNFEHVFDCLGGG